MIDYDDLSKIEPYSLNKSEKEQFLNDFLSKLTIHHYNNCLEYKKLLDKFGFDKNLNYKEIPFLPVRLFKEYELLSISKDDIIKTMTSSGTTGQQVSKIFLDTKTSQMQTKILTKIVSDFIGKKRMPMIILDTSAIMKDRKMFSARGAGILGFSMFGRDKIYAFDENMNLDIDGLKAFLEKHKDEKILLFGFTFMIWDFFYKPLSKSDWKPDLSNAVLIHGGGWKKLIDQAVSREKFHESLNSVCNISKIHDYYGMVEQTGSIYMECEHGNLHTSVFSDVIARRPQDFSECDFNEKGILEVVSVLPMSYPGHILLTEDEGMICGEDDCSCGRKGKYFKIFGRIKNAEIRGCSDTYDKK